MEGYFAWSLRDNMAPVIFNQLYLLNHDSKGPYLYRIKQIITCHRKYVFSFLEKYATVNNSEDNKGFRLHSEVRGSLNKRR